MMRLLLPIVPPWRPAAAARCPLLLIAMFAWVCARAQAPAVNWVLPLFTDQEGYRSMTLRGSEVRPLGPNRIGVTDLSIAIFSGDAAARVETMLLCSSATFFSKEKRASGDRNVRVIRDEVEITGENWTYDHALKKVSIRKNVRVVYRAPLRLPL